MTLYNDVVHQRRPATSTGGIQACFTHELPVVSAQKGIIASRFHGLQLVTCAWEVQFLVHLETPDLVYDVYY